MTILQLLINGIALGAAIALVALGFVLILNAVGAVNFAQGDLAVAGGFVAVALAGLLPVPGILLLPLVAVLMFGFGIVFSHVAYRPLRDRPPTAVFVSTIAVGIMVQNSLNAGFGPMPRTAPPLFGAGHWTVGGLVVEKQAIAITIVAVVLIAGVHWLLSRTQIGRHLRATAQDREMASAIGVPVGRMIALTFGLGIGLAGVAGLLLANRFFVTPVDGTQYMILAYMAVVVGGWGSVRGAVAGAFLIAVFEVLVAAAISQPVATGLLYLAVLGILIVRPQGLYGEAASHRA